MKYLISQETLNKVVNILTKLPYNEVFNVINELQSDIKPYIEKEDKE